MWGESSASSSSSSPASDAELAAFDGGTVFGGGTVLGFALAVHGTVFGDQPALLGGPTGLAVPIGILGKRKGGTGFASGGAFCGCALPAVAISSAEGALCGITFGAGDE